MKEKTSWSAHASIIWSINGVGKLSLGHEKFKSRKSVQMQMVPCFLLTGTGLETQVVYAMGYMNPTLRSFSISALTVGSFEGWMGLLFWHMGATSGCVSIQSSTIDGSIPCISIQDQEKISWNSWKGILYEVNSWGEHDAPSVISSTIPGVVDTNWP